MTALTFPEITGTGTGPAVPEGPVRWGSEEHKRLFCKTLLDSFNPYRPAVIDWHSEHALSTGDLLLPDRRVLCGQGDDVLFLRVGLTCGPCIVVYGRGRCCDFNLSDAEPYAF